MRNEDVIKLMAILGFNLVEVGYVGSDDETDWQKENEDWMEKMEICSVGEYFVNQKTDESVELFSGDYSMHVDFLTDWNWIMRLAVVRNIKEVPTEIHEAAKRVLEDLLS